MDSIILIFVGMIETHRVAPVKHQMPEICSNYQGLNLNLETHLAQNLLTPTSQD